jgi:hypothetical protein
MFSVFDIPVKQARFITPGLITPFKAEPSIYDEEPPNSAN